MQLTPVLLNLLKVDLISDQKKDKKDDGVDAEEARRKELERVLGGAGGKTKGGEKERTGMEWGSVAVFSCVKGCGGEWGEEWVGVEWED